MGIINSIKETMEKAIDKLSEEVNSTYIRIARQKPPIGKPYSHKVWKENKDALQRCQHYITLLQETERTHENANSHQSA